MTRSMSTLGLLSIFTLLWVEHVTAADRESNVRVVEDPFAYCARVGTIDVPAGGASPPPPPLMPYLRATLGLSAEAALAPQQYFWRCMDRAVYVCAIGANKRCDVKADRAKRNAGADNYCHENPNAAFVPAYATGHNSVYEWRCSAGKAVADPSAIKLDRRGYRTDLWYRVLPP